MQDPLGIDPLAQTVELKIRPSQVAIAGLTLLAVFGAAMLVLRLMVRGLPQVYTSLIASGAEFQRVDSHPATEASDR